jgi:3-carboxy-cis,cis-muconate cycloisomerase
LPIDGGLFTPIVTSDEMLAATSDQAWLQALLDVEAALAGAQADAGMIPAEAAAAISHCCIAGRFDADQLGRAARLGGNPVIPLVEALIATVPEDARRWVHWGATSQDILDSATMVVAKRALVPVDVDLAGLAAGCADLAERHRDTLMAGRTLLQQALPITFGLKASGWLVAVLDVRAQLRAVEARLAVQLGGAAGTLASLGRDGPDVIARLAARLELAEPVVPWHTARQRVAELAAALGEVAGTAAKIAMDVALLMQSEVGEAFEPSAPGRGGSSALPHKRNPVGAAAVSAAARRAHALLPVIFGAMIAEHERAVGGWQAEWQTLTELLQLAGGAAARVRETIEGLEVDTHKMADNLAGSGGLLMAERITSRLSDSIDRATAKQAVQAAARRSQQSGRPFAIELLEEPALAGTLSTEELDELLDPAGYLGATATFIDRALQAQRDSS